MVARFETFSEYILRHSGGKKFWWVHDSPGRHQLDKYPPATHHRFTKAEWERLRAKYAAEFGYQPYSDQYKKAARCEL